MSTKFVDKKKEKEEKLVQNQVCEGKIICKDKASCDILEQICRTNNYWPVNDDCPRIYPKVPIRLITKYNKEITLGCSLLSLVDNEFDITPFYPLLAFPRRDDRNF